MTRQPVCLESSSAYFLALSVFGNRESPIETGSLAVVKAGKIYKLEPRQYGKQRRGRGHRTDKAQKRLSLLFPSCLAADLPHDRIMQELRRLLL